MDDDEVKKLALLDQLYKREQERVASFETKKSEKQNKIIREETFEAFKPKFLEFKNEIEAKIEMLDSLSKEDKVTLYDDLLNQLNSLQNLLTDGIKYLNAFHIEKFSEEIKILRNTINSKHMDEQKEKKFNFKNAKKKVIIADDSIAIPLNKHSIISKVISNFDTNRTIQISNLKHIVQTYNSEINQKEIRILNLSDSTIYLHGNPSTVQINDCLNCKIFIGPVSGSVFVDKLANSRLTVACHQLRIHNTRNTDFNIHVSTKAIIEDCKEVRFGRYNFQYENNESDFIASKLNHEVNNWNKIDDFNWLVADVPSPNWSLLED